MTFSTLDFSSPLGLYFLGVAFVFGLCIGSFLNVVALRFLADMPLAFPASHCPQCQTPIRPYDNIPVLGWLLLGGRCRACKQRISLQYPLVEFSTGLLFALCFWRFGMSWTLLLLLFLIANLIVIFITDLKEKLIFEVNSLSLIPAGLLYNCLIDSPAAWSAQLGTFSLVIPQSLVSALSAIAIAFVFFEGMILFSKTTLGTEGFGHGDTHLMMGVGAFLGWPLMVLALLLGFVMQSVPAIPMLVYGWVKAKQYTPLISGAVALAASSSPLVLLNTDLPPGPRLALCLLSLLVAIAALVVFMRNIRQSENFTYLPLGPALILGSLTALFAGEELLQLYMNYLGFTR
jgi:leader peptidase (prepilin peptidase) / N-methyltransferase